MLQKIEAFLPQLGAQPTVSAEKLAWANEQARLLFGSFRKADADDPVTFTAGCLRLFTSYEPDVVRYVIDPMTGLPGQLEWLPTLAKVKAALEERAGFVGRIRGREKLERETIAARASEAKRAERKPTLEEMKAKHGDNWGLQAREQDRAVSRRMAELGTRANRVTFERECVAAGFPKDSPVSPFLAALIKAGMA